MTPEIRNPLCIPPHGTTRGSQVEMIDRQAARIVELEGQLVCERAKLHDANNRIQCAEGALELIASLLGLGTDASAPEVVAAAMARLK
jgi:hypothetical protein